MNHPFGPLDGLHQPAPLLHMHDTIEAVDRALDEVHVVGVEPEGQRLDVAALHMPAVSAQIRHEGDPPIDRGEAEPRLAPGGGRAYQDQRKPAGDAFAAILHLAEANRPIAVDAS